MGKGSLSKIFGDLLATTFSRHLGFVESDDNSEVSQISHHLFRNYKYLKSWKIASSAMIHKKTSTTQDPNNYRSIISQPCWAAAKPGRSERGQKKAATLTTRPAVKNLDREVGRPNQRRTAKCTASTKTDGHFGGQTKSAKRKIFKYYIQIS
ncbi:hypothetical protein BpHYR1_003460 [Brachionus plicatilis]|uniref:Uncharacterized protein n=1 Tax=Brachionus plicatilis TaxID=10195 RepID=A0A3M7TAT5_BRAPC|nr:hypothetical protein BpHYR1_003460 [Brachionus plicatilis]